MTSLSEITMISTKRKNKTKQQLEDARARAAHARSVREEKARSRKEAKQADPAKDFLDLQEFAQAMVIKISSLEHQAAQYRTVIDYLESKIDSMRTDK